MNNTNVIAMPASTTFVPDQALNSALTDSLTDVLVIGYDTEGVLVIRSSRMTCAEALFMLEKAKRWALSGGQET